MVEKIEVIVVGKKIVTIEETAVLLAN